MVGRILSFVALLSVAPSVASAQAGASLDAPAPSSYEPGALPLAAELPSADVDLSVQPPPELPRHPVGFIATGVPLMVAGLGLGIPSVIGAAQPGCSGGWFCIDLRPVFYATTAVGGVMFLISVGLLVHGISRWASVDRERDRIAREQAGALVLDGRGIGLRF